MTTHPEPPFNFTLQVSAPRDLKSPIVIRSSTIGVEMLLCRVEALRGRHHVDRTWGVPGVYVLLGPPSRTDVHEVRARPGYGGDVVDRATTSSNDHSDWCRRVLLIRRAGDVGYDTAQIGAIEGLLHDTCRAAPRIEHVDRIDRDETPLGFDEIRHDLLPLVQAVLTIAGLTFLSEEQLTALHALPPRRREDDTTPPPSGDPDA